MSIETTLTSNQPAIIDPDAFAVANETANAMGEPVFVHKLTRPVTYNGKEYSELSFDWWSLTGADGLQIENEMQRLNKPVIVPALSGDYLIRMAARACAEQVGTDIFEQMALFDYNKIRSAARSFLLNSES